jgi:hypothetical protein
MVAKCNKGAIILKQNGCGCLLVVSIITGIEDFYAWLLAWFN